MAFETDIVTLPAYWACALINGDESGMEDEERRHLEAALDRLEPWYVVDVVEDSERFTWSYRLYDPLADCDGGDVADYVVHRVR